MSMADCKHRVTTSAIKNGVVVLWCAVCNSLLNATPVDCAHKWEQITPAKAWCSACGGLREGTWKDTEYPDPESGDLIEQSSTGYYRPGLSGGHIWEEGPVPGEYHVEVFGEPYTYRMPGTVC